MREGNRIGIVGGGQLGRMLTSAAHELGYRVSVVEKGPDCPAAQVGAEQIEGTIQDRDAILELGSRVGVLTWEVEHINVDAVEEAAETGANVEPSPLSLRIIKDKLEQKKYLRKGGVPLGPFLPVRDAQSLQFAHSVFNNGFMLKQRTTGFDGRGNRLVDEPVRWNDLDEAFKVPGLYAEELVDFEKELSVVIARDKDGAVMPFPIVETIHKDSICHIVSAPAQIDSAAEMQAYAVAHQTVSQFEGAGVFAVEMFLTRQGNILVNEVAPRVHNSGHHTIEANVTSQFEQHIRAVTGLPLGSTEMVKPAAVMINILGQQEGPLVLDGLAEALAYKDAHVHLYGKQPRPARKIGHITVRANSVDEAKDIAIKARKELLI